LPRILLENGGDFYWTLGAGFDGGFEGLRRIRANADEAWLMIFCLYLSFVLFVCPFSGRVLLRVASEVWQLRELPD
jgi:hypothetical protein